MVDWDLVNEVNDLYTCYRTDAEGCTLCTHKDLCIFDDYLWELDKEIARLEKQLPYVGQFEEVGGLSINIEQEVMKRKIKKLKMKRRGKIL